MFPPSIDQEALAAEQLWATHCGTNDTPDNAQMRVWIRSCGMPALRHAIPLAGWKKRKCEMDGQPITPDGLRRYTSAAVKRRSLELGFVREFQQCAESPRSQSKPVHFQAPQEWLEADNVERIEVADWK